MKQGKTVFRDTTVGFIIEKFDNGLLRSDHPLQRRSGQHPNDIRDGFITSVAKNEDFDSVKLCQEGKTTWLIDAYQRLTHISRFMHDEFKLGKKVELPIVTYEVVTKDEDGYKHIEEREFDLRGKKWSDFPAELQKQFLNCPLRTTTQEDCTSEEVGYHIRRYNRTVRFTRSQSMLTYADKSAQWIKRLSNNVFFNNCTSVSANAEIKGELEKIVMNSLILMFTERDIKGSADVVGKFVDENITEENFAEMEDLLDRLLIVCEGDYCDLFNAKNVMYFIKLFRDYTQLGHEDEEFADFLNEFVAHGVAREFEFEAFDEAMSWEAIEGLSGSQDKKIMTAKMEILDNLLKEFFKVEEEEIQSIFHNEPEDVTSLEVITKFVKEMVSPNIEEEDVDFYIDCLDDYLARNVEEDSYMRDDENKRSMVAIVAFAQTKNIDDDLFEGWLGTYASNVHTYVEDQGRNYMMMKGSLQDYIIKNKVA